MRLPNPPGANEPWHGANHLLRKANRDLDALYDDLNAVGFTHLAFRVYEITQDVDKARELLRDKCGDNDKKPGEDQS